VRSLSRKSKCTREFSHFACSHSGQAALEFIMTYGWAILVVLVAIGALSYFGVLSPDKFLPSRCTLSAGIACLDHYAESSISEIGIVLKNSLGYDVKSVSVTASGCTTSATLATFKNGATNTFAPSGCSITSGQRYSGQINFSYTNMDTDLTHNLQGTLITKIT